MMKSILLTILLGSTLQGVVLAAVSLVKSGELACADQFINFTCIVSSLEAQWVAEPLINASGSNIVTFFNDPSTNGRTVQQGPSIVIRQESAEPLVTVMTVRGDLDFDLTVRCIAIRDDLTASDQFTSSATVPDVYNLDLQSHDVDIQGGVIAIDFDHPDIGIARYEVSCKSNACDKKNFATTGGLMDVQAGDYILQVRAINICGIMSEVVTAPISVRLDSGELVVVIILSISLLFIVIMPAVIIALGGYIYKLKHSKVCQDDEELPNMEMSKTSST